MTSISPQPSQTQLVLPVLQTLDQNGGRAKTTDLYEAVAERTGIPVEARAASTTLASAGRINTFARSVRWAQQRGKLLGLMRPVEPGIWEITDTGRRRLRTSRPGLVITIFVTERGAALWAAAEDAIGYLDDGSVQLILTFFTANSRSSKPPPAPPGSRRLLAGGGGPADNFPCSLAPGCP
jgi:site-specific DNA-methyltransferase (cytosine-N4-specific)